MMKYDKILIDNWSDSTGVNIYIFDNEETYHEFHDGTIVAYDTKNYTVVYTMCDYCKLISPAKTWESKWDKQL